MPCGRASGTRLSRGCVMSRPRATAELRGAGSGIVPKHGNAFKSKAESELRHNAQDQQACGTGTFALQKKYKCAFVNIAESEVAEVLLWFTVGEAPKMFRFYRAKHQNALVLLGKAQKCLTN